MCILLLVKIQEVSGLVVDMRQQEASGIDSLILATAVRQQSLQIAHSMIDADRSHLDEYRTSRETVRSRIQKLGPEIPHSENARLAALGDKTQRMHDTFMKVLLPLLEQGDLRGARRVHRELDEIGQDAASEADALALAVRTRMHHSHRDATAAARAGVLMGGACATVVLLLSAWFTVRLRDAALVPLFKLTESVRRFGQGDLTARVGDLGESEVGELAQVFDRMADELNEREGKLIRQERMAAIGQLAAGVAHELNNPIGIIRGYLKTMHPEENDETLREELKILDEEAAQCQRIAEDLLSYSRASELELEEVDVAPFLKSAVERFVEQLSDSKPVVTVEVEPQRIRMDSGRVRQVIFNLLKNSLEATRGRARVSLVGRGMGDLYRIEIEDNGPGIPTEDRSRIFEPFFSQRKGGTGLGLAVVSGIVRGHGGTVEALEGREGGALFRLDLPIVGPPTSVRPPATEKSR